MHYIVHIYYNHWYTRTVLYLQKVGEIFRMTSLNTKAQRNKQQMHLVAHSGIQAWHPCLTSNKRHIQAFTHGTLASLPTNKINSVTLSPH
jgi:hypothetical protein